MTFIKVIVKNSTDWIIVSNGWVVAIVILAYLMFGVIFYVYTSLKEHWGYIGETGEEIRFSVIFVLFWPIVLVVLVKQGL